MIEDVQGKRVLVCIAGMHRSGTSTVAQLLNRCGLYLGRKGELFGASPDNQDGYWEHKKIVRINEDILKAFGGGWDLPPSLEEGWHTDERLNDLRARAEEVVQGFEGHEPWGWKDPRSNLTLPFWLDLLPETKVVVCLRNPLEVADSLRRRGNSSYVFSFNLWTVYTRKLLEALPEKRYIVTHYEAYFYRSQAEIRRVLDFLGMPASDQRISQARSISLKGLRHHQHTVQDLLDSDATPEMKQLYFRLCREANWDYGLPDVPEQTVSEQAQ